MGLTVVGMLLSALLVLLCYRRLDTLRELSELAWPHLDGFRRGRAARAPSSREQVAEMNETTIELQARLDQPAWVSQRCARAAFALGGALVLIQVAGRLGSTGARDWMAPALSFASGCAAAIACSAIGRSADRRARELREEWNALIRQSAQDVPT